MISSSLQKLEHAIKARSVFLADRLNPGLLEPEIRAALKRAGITGAVQPVVDFYLWKNGTILDDETALEKTGFFPDEIYQFIDLETAIQNWKAMNVAAQQLSEVLQDTEAEPMFELAGQYFPMFWDGATGSLDVDLRPANNNRLMMIEFESTEPVCEAYGNFSEFIADAIRANTEGGTLACFQTNRV